MRASDRGAYLEALLENLPLATMVLDSDRRTIMCNPAFERLFGYRISDILGKTPDKFLMPPSRATEIDGIIRSVTAGEVVQGKSQRSGSMARLWTFGPLPFRWCSTANESAAWRCTKILRTSARPNKLSARQKRNSAACSKMQSRAFSRRRRMAGISTRTQLSPACTVIHRLQN